MKCFCKVDVDDFETYMVMKVALGGLVVIVFAIGA
jgi:hypothetical protein